MKATVSFTDYSKFPPNYWKWLAIALLILLAIVYTKAWASGEPDWDTLIPIIIKIESNGNPHAISKAGCIGLMQISPMVLKEWNTYWEGELSKRPGEPQAMGYVNKKVGIGDLFDIKTNILLGTWYLRRIWFHYLPHYKLEQNIENLLIAYNFGIGNLVKYRQGKIKLPRETRNYIATYKKISGREK